MATPLVAPQRLVIGLSRLPGAFGRLSFGSNRDGLSEPVE